MKFEILKTCPQHNGRLVFLGGGFTHPEDDFPSVGYYFCPVCEVVVVQVAGKITSREEIWVSFQYVAPEIHFKVHPLQGDGFLNTEQWVSIFGIALDQVAEFLSGRHEDWRYCHDRFETTFLKETSFDDNRTLKFTWCKWCKSVFVFISEKDYGTEYIAQVKHQPNTQRFEILQFNDEFRRWGIEPQKIETLVDSLEWFDPSVLNE